MFCRLCKMPFYRAANNIFSIKIRRIASEEVVFVLQLIKSKCVPVLLHGLEACALNKFDIASLDFRHKSIFHETNQYKPWKLVGCVAQLVERRSLTGKLSLSCARLAADG